MLATSCSRKAADDSLEVAPCPRCGSVDSVIVASGRDYLHSVPGVFYASECCGCGLWFQNPRPSDEHIAGLYPVTYGPHAKLQSALSTTSTFIQQSRWIPQQQQAHRSERAWSSLRSLLSRRRDGVNLIPTFVPKGKLLEIGSGNGERLVILRDHGWTSLCGIELVPRAAEQASAQGFAVECGPVEQLLEAHPNQTFDVIVSSMVLEHLCNPFGVVRQIAAKLKPGGQFLFSTICRDSLDARIYGKYWAGFDFPRHMVYLRKRDIKSMLVADFDQIECFHQSAPIDYVRSSTWRRGDTQSHFFDLVILKWGMTRTMSFMNTLLALFGMTCRVSYRCRRRPSN